MKMVGYQFWKLSVISFAICPARNSEVKDIAQVNNMAVKAKELTEFEFGKSGGRGQEVMQYL